MKFKNQVLMATVLLLVAIASVLFMQRSHAFEGFYAGGSFGGILSPVNHLGDKVTDIVVSGSGFKINEEWQTARKPSMNFTLSAGFGRLYDKHYSGVEGSINKMRYRMKISKASEDRYFKAKDEINLNLRDVYFAIDYRQGYLVSQKTMVYAKTGVMRTRARISLHSDSVIMSADGQHLKNPTHLKHEKIIHPARIGFGVEHKFMDNVSATVDYTYMRYLRHFKLKGQTKYTSEGGEVTSNHKHTMTIQDTSIMAGLKYHF